MKLYLNDNMTDAHQNHNSYQQEGHPDQYQDLQHLHLLVTCEFMSCFV